MSRPFAERLVALILLAGSVAYGLAAQEIQLLLSAQFSPFNARTFPTLLAGAGTVLAALILVFPGAGDGEAFAGLAWRPAALLCAAVIAYAYVIPHVGFFAASAAFIAAGCLVLGERRARVLAPLSVGIALGLWALLDLGLGIFLDDPLLRALGLQ